MPTTGPIEVIELAVLNLLFQAYPTFTPLQNGAVIQELSNSANYRDRPQVTSQHHRLIPEILVGLVQRADIQIDERSTANLPILSDDSFHSGNQPLDRLRQHVLGNGILSTLISLRGLERRDALLA